MSDEPARPVGKAPSGNGGHVLVVDDSRSVRAALRALNLGDIAQQLASVLRHHFPLDAALFQDRSDNALALFR